jgi:cobalt/nickel transport system permease protein
VLLAHALLPAAALALSRIRPGEVLRGGLLLAAAFAVLMAAPATLNLVRDGQVVVPLVVRAGAWHVGPVTVPAVIGVTREGLLGAATFCLRVVTSAAVVLWLALGTRWSDLLAALRAVGVPAVVVQIAGMTVRYLHLLLRQSHEAHLAKRSRTVCRRRLAAEHAWVGSRIGLTWLHGLHLMEEVGEAMTARGFTGEIPPPARAGFAVVDWLFLSLVVLACLGTRLA